MFTNENMDKQNENISEFTKLKNRKSVEKYGDLRADVELLPNLINARTSHYNIDELIEARKQSIELSSMEPTETGTVSVRLDQRTIFQINEYTKLLGISKSAFLRDTITQEVFNLGLKLFKEGLLNESVKRLEKKGFNNEIEVIKICLQNKAEAER